MFAEVGEGTCVESPFYANFGVTFVDHTHIYIGDYTMIGPNVTIATAGHPLDPDLRRQGLRYNLPIHIGRNCWLGAGVVALGNPCRVLREIGERDRRYYYRNMPVDETLFDIKE